MKIAEKNDDIRQLEQFQGNEQRTNAMAAAFSRLFVAMSIVSHILVQFDYSYGVLTVNTYIGMPLSVLILILLCIVRHCRYKGRWVRNALMVAIIVECIASFSAYTTYTAYMLFLPMVISTCYYNRRFTLIVSVSTLILFIISCIVNLILEPRSELIQLLHRNSGYNLWLRPIDAVFFLMIPVSLTFVFLMFFTFGESKNGHGLLREQVRSAARVATVENELNMAAEIQRSALPAPSFSMEDGSFRIFAEEITAKEVGGDFYDYFMLSPNVLSVLIADVSDKGAPAAMFMMSAQKAIRCALQCCHSLSDAIELANKLICQENKSGMFLTLWLGLIDTRTGMGKFVNAGHPAPLIHHTNGSVTELVNEPDLFLGNFPEITPAVNLFRLEAGDTLLLYTDGLTDAMNTSGESFGQERLTDTMKMVHTDAEHAVHTVISAARSFAGAQEQFDDITVLALECSHLEPRKENVFEVSSNSAGTKEIIDGVDAFLKSLDCPDETRRNMAVVVDELCANVSDYAYDGEDGPMRVEAEGSANYITLRFIDSGIAFDPLEHADPVCGDEPIIGGFGIFFVKNLVDDITYMRQEEQNILSVTKVWSI